MTPIAAIRERLHETPEQFAQGLRISAQWLAKLESGEVTMTHAVAMKLLLYARDRDLPLVLDHIYGMKPLP